MTTSMPESTRHMKRRSVLKAAAWSAPVIAVAAATPAASASATVDVDVFLESPQLGESIAFYGPDYTTSYSWGSFLAFHVSNAGTEDAPAGSIVQVTYDPRIFAYNVAPYATIGGVDHEFAFTVDNVSATSAILTITLDVPIPAQTTWESSNAILVRTGPSFLLRYPNDTITNPASYSEVLSNAADQDSTNNSRGPFSATQHDSGPYTFSLESTAAPLASGGCTFTAPETMSVTNTGWGTPADHTVLLQLDVDNTAITDVAIESISINGTALSGVTLTPPTDESSSWWIETHTSLAVDGVLETTLSYTVDPSAGLDPFSQGASSVSARIRNDFANYSYDFWAYRGEFPRDDYSEGICTP